MRRYVFSDEAGDFEFVKKPNVSRYFIACAVSMDACDIGHELLNLRREMAWDEMPLGDYFHASEDKHAVREKVFAFLGQFDFKVYAQVLEKSKCQPQIRSTKERFYKHAWFYLFKYAMPKTGFAKDDELLVTTASIGTKKGQKTFSHAVNDVLLQTASVEPWSWRAFFCSAASEPCVQVADYCTWAIQRKWEKGEDHFYSMIKPKIHHEYDMWGHGKTHYY
jgi:hypothetical protein